MDSKYTVGVAMSNGSVGARWETPSERIARAISEWQPEVVNNIGKDYLLVSGKAHHLEVHAWLCKMLLAEANLYQSKGTDAEVIDLVKKELPTLWLGAISAKGNKMLKLHRFEQKNYKFDVYLGEENLLGLKLNGEEYLLASTETTYPDGMSSNSIVIFAKETPTAISTLENLCDVVDKAVKRANRGLKRIKVFGGRDIALNQDVATDWESVFLPDDIKRRIQQDLDLFLNHKDFFKELGLPYKRGFLLCGSPGNGKTSTVRSIATSMPFVSHMFDFSNPKLGNSDLTEAFQTASENAPAAFFLEDIDRIYDHDDNRNEHSNVTLDCLLNCLDGIAVNNGLLVVATANNPEKLDPAILSRPGRFDQVIVFPEPDEALRFKYLKYLFRKATVDDAVIQHIVDNSEGMSMAFLKEIFVCSASRSISSTGINITAEAVYGAVEDISKQYGGISQAGNRKTGFSKR